MPVIRNNEGPIEEGGETSTTGRFRSIDLSAAGGLGQFGAHLETLFPRSRSSICHWHANEDELVYMISGELVLYEGKMTLTLRPGDVACFPAGNPEGHYLENCSQDEAQFLVVGTRAPSERVTYPDDDRILDINRVTGGHSWTTHDGAPADNPYEFT